MSANSHSCNGHDPARKPRPVPDVAPAAVERAANLFRAMGDAMRLRTLQLLSGRECCVSELVAALGEKFSTVSQRLRVLRGEGLVVRRREGTHLFYALADQHVGNLIANALDHAVELEAGGSRKISTPDEGESE